MSCTFILCFFIIYNNPIFNTFLKFFKNLRINITELVACKITLLLFHMIGQTKVNFNI